MPHEDHGKYMQGLEEEAFREESRIHHDFLSSCQATLCHSPQLLRGALATSYHLLLGQAPPSPLPILPQRTPPVEEQPPTAALPTPMAKLSPRPKRQHPSSEPMRSTPMGRATPKAMLGGPPQPQEVRDPSLVQVT